MTDDASAGVTLDHGAVPMDSPIVEGLEKGADLVLLLESKLGRVDPGEGEGVLVTGVEVVVRREEIDGVEAEVGPALIATVNRRHWSDGGRKRKFGGVVIVRGKI